MQRELGEHSKSVHGLSANQERNEDSKHCFKTDRLVLTVLAQLSSELRMTEADGFSVVHHHCGSTVLTSDVIDDVHVARHRSVVAQFVSFIALTRFCKHNFWEGRENVSW